MSRATEPLMLLLRKSGDAIDQNYLFNVLPQHPAEDKQRQGRANAIAEDWLSEYLDQHPTKVD